MKLGGMATGFEPLKDKAKVGVIATAAAGTYAMLLKMFFGPTIPKLQAANACCPNHSKGHSHLQSGLCILRVVWFSKKKHQVLQSKLIAAPSAHQKQK